MGRTLRVRIEHSRRHCFVPTEELSQESHELLGHLGERLMPTPQLDHVRMTKRRSRAAAVDQPRKDRILGTPHQKRGNIDARGIRQSTVVLVRETPPHPGKCLGPGLGS